MNNFVAQHSTAFIIAAIYLLIAAVNTMPDKSASWSGQTLYGWFYDFVHVVINAAVKRYPALAELPTVGTVITTTSTPAIPATSQTVVTQKETQ